MKKSVMGVLFLMLSAGAAFAGATGPLLIPDYDRDGAITVEKDYAKARAGETFAVWLNDDDDANGAESDDGKGDTNSDLHDIPGGEDNDRDCEDSEVNGRCDLIDFFPVLIDVSGVEEWSDYAWTLSSKSVNVIFTALDAAHAGDFHTKDVKAFDGETPLYRASVAKLAGEDGEAAELPDGFLKDGRGVIVVEGAALGDEGLTLRGTKDDGDPVEVTLNLRVANVESLYGWMNLRDSQPSTLNPQLPQPDSRHFILVHGYNTNHEEARGNAAEFYKKLWQSGFDGMFTAVEWQGDQSQIKFGLLGVNFTPNYYVNVENAFAAARPFADACAKLPGEKILVGHSLGNMLIASAIRDYGLDYTKYVMLNAAVPREAYDAGAYDEAMVPEAWRGEGVGVGEGVGGGELTDHLDRAARWYRNFADKKYDPYEYRRKLAWRGRFANLPRTVNYYSPTDNILLNPDPNDPDPDKVIDRNDPDIYNKVRALLVAKLINGRSIGSGGSKKTGFGFWSFSEKLKGTWLLDTVNDVLTNTLGVAQADAYKREGGWGENADFEEDKPFDPANTRFTPFLDPRLKTQGMLDILPAETERVRAQHLADAIPSESFAAGANEVATLENVNLEGFIGENPDWPLYEGDGTKTNLWNHSAFREVAFYHTSKLYASLAATGKPRVIIDTDLGSCMDDLFAIDLAARMHKQGKLDLLAVMMDRPDGHDPEQRGEFLKFADRYLASLGLGDLPIGKAMLPIWSALPQRVFNPYWTLIYSNNLTGVGLLLPTNRTDEQIASLPRAVTLYRRLLNDASPKSVVVCSTGFLSNLSELMDSGANYEGDGIASTGMELIAAKVKELRIMAGCFDYSVAPDGKGGAEYNAAGDPAAAKKVLEGWPTPVVVSPWEVGLKLEYLPEAVLADFPAGTPDPVVRAAYTYWPEPKGEVMNRLWDPATILPLTEGETLLPLSEMGGIAVDEEGRATFTPNASSNRCYQVASNMNEKAVMNRIRAICRTGNPSLSMLVSGKAEPGVDYNGSELVFKFENIQLGSFTEDDLRFGFTVGGAEHMPESSEWDEVLGVLSVRFSIPPDVVTAGNVYTGKLEVAVANDALGTNLLVTASRQLVQGAMVECADERFFDYVDAPTNYVPETEMPEGVTARVTTTASFTGEPFKEQYLSAAGAVQAAVRIVGDGADGYKFQFYAFAVDEEENLHKGWWDCNVGNVVPVAGNNYEITAELMYPVDAKRQLYTVAFFAKDTSDNQPARPVFLGNMINDDGGFGNAGRLGSVSLTEPGAEIILNGFILVNKLNVNLAKIDDYDAEYATVAEAVGEADDVSIRLLHAASWKPTKDDVSKPVRFLNKSWLNLDLSDLPTGTRAVWTDEDGNNGTLTLEPVFADTVVYGTIRTAETENPVAEALAIKDGKYVYVGDEDGAAAFIKDGVTKVIDHRGKGMVMPGCTDGHSHYTMKFGLDNMKGGVMFDDSDDKDAILEKLEAAAQAAEASGKESLFGYGWDFATIMLGDKPTLAELDAVTYGVSTVIFDSTVHNAFCNSACLRRCGIIDADGNLLVDKIDGGLLELDENGRPTGYANERVTGYLMRMGGVNQDEIVDDEVAESTMRATQKLLLSTGYTMALEGWSNLLHPSKFYEAAHRMDTNGELKVVFPMTYEVEPWQTNMNEQIEHLAWLNEVYGTDHVRPEYLKIFMDGCVETMTGAISKPYKTGVSYSSFWPVDRLAAITRDCNAKGLTVHIHAMGDSAVKEVTDAYIQGGDRTRRNCLVHLRNVNTNDFQRFADNNIACTAGMTWHVTLHEEGDLMRQFIEDEYVDHSYPIRSFFDVGVKVSSHSDFPANEGCPQDPFGIMYVAVTGLAPNPREGDEPYDADELVTIEQVFQALTINGAWQLGLENERGSIAVGKWADFVLADQDVFECATTDIGKTKVVSTWFEGEKVYPAVPEAVSVTLPTGVQGYSYVVSNLTVGIEMPAVSVLPGGTSYELPIGAKVGIYAVPAAGYVVSGTNPYVIEKVTAETALEDVTLPMAVEPVAADTVVYGTIRTAEAGNPVAEAFAVRDGKYVYVGDEAVAAAFVADGVTEIVDHRGKGMVMPGCTDGHSHYAMKFGLANMKGGVLFSRDDGKDAVLKKLKDAALAAKDAGKKSLFGFGWDMVKLMEETPSLKELDDATFGISTVILDSGGHHAFCNTECLLRCGIVDVAGNVLVKEIPGGYLELDESGYPTGYAEERAMGYLMRMGGIDYDELMDDETAEISVRKTRDLLLSTGYTIALEGWSNILHSNKLYKAAKRLDENDELNLVFPMTYEVEPWMSDAEMSNQIDYLDALNETYATAHVLPSYLKIFMDGVVETKTGAMLKPYKDDQTYYKSFWTTNRLADITAASNAKGLTVHVHTMGDAAVQDTVTAFIEGGDGAHRNCLVHLRNVNSNDFRRIAVSGIACSAGFTWHVSPSEKEAALLEIFLEKEYVDHAYPIKSFFDAGVKVSSHSDFPANEPCPQDPFGIMQVAVTGLPPNPTAGLKPHDTNELVTVGQVFEALTVNGAWQVGLEAERGSIAVGKYADFVLADRDVFECAPTDIGKTKVVSTWFEGEKVYQLENGGEDTPWKVGATKDDTVVAWTNGTQLVVDGDGEMKDFDPAAPWADSGVTAAVVGEEVDTIGANAFADCAALKTIVFESETPPVLGEGNDLSGVRIFVPFAAADGYRGTWPELAAQIEEMRSADKELASQLHELSYKWWDAAYANSVAEKLAGILSGRIPTGEAPADRFLPYDVFNWYGDLGVIDELREWAKVLPALCTSCRNGDFVGRNFDWAYDDVDECVMLVPADEGRLASVGVASWFFPEPLQTFLDVDKFLPELTMDGVNEKGVAINVNVVPAGDNGETTGTNPGGKRLCAGFAVRSVLDAATNAAHAVAILQERDIYSLRGLEFHWMISDAAESYVVECVSNQLVVLRAHDARPKMSNYYVSHSPSVGDYDVVTNAQLTATEHTPHAMGVERYVNVSNGLEGVDSVAAMFTHMTNVWYKAKYLPGNEQKYWSDLNGAPVPGKPGLRFEFGDETVADRHDDRMAAFRKIQENYVLVTNYEAQTGCRTIDDPDKRGFKNEVVHTVHTSIYDIRKQALTVCVQERAAQTFTYGLKEACTVIVGSGEKTLGEADPVGLATNFTLIVTGGRFTAKDFGGYCVRAKGEAEGDYAVNFICTRMPQGFDGPFEVVPGVFTIVMGEMLPADGAVTYPKAAKDSEFLKPNASATWKAKPDACSVFAGWAAATNAPEVVSNLLAAAGAKVLKTTLTLKIPKDAEVRPTDVVATWKRLDEDVPAGQVAVMLRCDPAMGKVSGGKLYKLNKKGEAKVSINATAAKDCVFAGWYEDPGFSVPAVFWTGTGKNAKPKDYRNAAQSLTVTTNVYLFARFVAKTTKADPITRLRFLGAGYCGADASEFAETETWYQGVALPTNGCAVAFGSASLPTVTVSGLPSGVKFDKAAQRFTGVPTAASTEKKPFFAVKISVKNKSGATDVLVKNVRVEPHPVWAAGSFDGVFCERPAEADEVERGKVAFTVGSNGKVSGKTLTGGKSYAFSSKALDDVVEIDGELVFVAHPAVKVGKEEKLLTLYVFENEHAPAGMAEILYGEEEDSPRAVAVQNAWKLKVTGLPSFPTGSKALKLTDEELGLTLKFGAKGAVSYAGKVAGDTKAVSVSGSTQLLPYVCDGEVMFARALVYVAPKKGFSSGLVKAYDLVFQIGEDGKSEQVDFRSRAQ